MVTQKRKEREMKAQAQRKFEGLRLVAIKKAPIKKDYLIDDYKKNMQKLNDRFTWKTGV